MKILDRQSVGKNSKCGIRLNVGKAGGYCENAVVFRLFALGLFFRVNRSKSTERVRVPRDGYFNVKRGVQATQL